MPRQACGYPSSQSCGTAATGTQPRAGRALVWRQRRFGNQVLRNGSYDGAGNSLGLSADDVPDQPTDTILCDSIRRFKGLDREVIVLVELGESDPRFAQLMYVGVTRARQHLVAMFGGTGPRSSGPEGGSAARSSPSRERGTAGCTRSACRRTFD